LLLVLAILVVLGGLVLTNFIGAQDSANANATKSQLNMLKQQVTQYRIQTNSMPETLEQLRDGPSDQGSSGSFQAIITTIPKDAWGKDISYTLNGNAIELRSGGIDGQMNTDDDIVVEGR
jgi:general secretion pathway protein G